MSEETNEKSTEEEAPKPKRRSRPHYSRNRKTGVKQKTDAAPSLKAETGEATDDSSVAGDSLQAQAEPSPADELRQQKKDEDIHEKTDMLSSISRIMMAVNRKTEATQSHPAASVIAVPLEAAAVPERKKMTDKPRRGESSSPPPAEATPVEGGAQEPVKKAPAKRKRSRPSRGGKAKELKKDLPEEPTPTPAEPPAEDVPAPVAEEEVKKNPKTAGKDARKTTARKPAKSTERAVKPAPKEPEPIVSAKKVLLINSEEPEECRVALLEGGKVEDFHVETIGRAQTKGNIYKGRIVAVESNLQAAFVEIGTEKNGFLPFSDIHPEYYYKEAPPDTHWKDIHIQDVVKKGQEVLVEIVKETTGTKGASLTTYLSLAGRYLVLMPGSDSHGISRKLEDSERDKLRKMIDGFNLPEGVGYIVRTASKDVTKTALLKDLKYLLNLWQEIKDAGQDKPSPSLLYKEQNIISRYLRDHYMSEIEEIIVDSEEAFKQVSSFLELLPERQTITKVRLHSGSQPIFDHYKVEEQIEQIFQARVPLPSGGSIVINSTEALVAIDVNSGRTSKDKNFEESIFLANMEAAEELARQLRLRDLGGLIVIDFIDMRSAKHTRDVEKTLKTSMKRDKSKWDMTRISRFGLMQISRQRLGPPVETGSYNLCPNCQGRGTVPSVETQALTWLRRIQNGMNRKNISRVECTLPMEVAHYLMNKKRHDLAVLEERHDIDITIKGEPGMPISASSLEFIDKA